mgnify:CR=1 FL=1
MDHNPSETRKLRQLLLDADYAPILELARKKNRILSYLTGLTFDLDPVISDRALFASGQAASIICSRDAEFVRNYVLRLFWLVDDESGGIGWRAPELIGEILHHCPQLEQFFPLLISLLDLEKEDAPRFLPGILWAIGRVAQVARAAMLPALPQVQAYASAEEDNLTRRQALWCLQQLNN